MLDMSARASYIHVAALFGTSMAAPGAAGAALLVRQYFVDGFYPTGAANAPDGFDPTAAMVKAMLINSGTPVDVTAGDNAGLLPGTTWYFQAWYRDPAAGLPAFNLSDGLEVVFGP